MNSYSVIRISTASAFDQSADGAARPWPAMATAMDAINMPVKTAIGKGFMQPIFRAACVARGGPLSRLFCDLAADFATFVGVGMHVDVPFSGQQLGCLSIG